MEEKQENLKDSLERKLDAALIKDGETLTVSPSTTLNNKEQNSLLVGVGSAVGLVPAVMSPEEEELQEIARQIVQKVFYSSRGNINFVHEVLRQVKRLWDGGLYTRPYVLKTSHRHLKGHVTQGNLLATSFRQAPRRKATRILMYTYYLVDEKTMFRKGTHVLPKWPCSMHCCWLPPSCL